MTAAATAAVAYGLMAVMSGTAACLLGLNWRALGFPGRPPVARQPAGRRPAARAAGS